MVKKRQTRKQKFTTASSLNSIIQSNPIPLSEHNGTGTNARRERERDKKTKSKILFYCVKCLLNTVIYDVISKNYG